jgi:hypothetical protein
MSEVNEIIILCECGYEYSLRKKKQHYKTKKHIRNIEEIFGGKDKYINKKIYTKEEEQQHLYNCQFRDYDQDIRSFK